MLSKPIHSLLAHILKNKSILLQTNSKRLFSIKCLLKPTVTFFGKPCHMIQTRSYILETTKVKLLQSYDDSVEHIKTLTAERIKLTDLTSNEAEMNKLEDKQDLFQRLDYLHKVSNVYESIVKAANDLRELSEMLATASENETDEFKRMLTDDVEHLTEDLLKHKTQMVQTLIPEVLQLILSFSFKFGMNFLLIDSNRKLKIKKMQSLSYRLGLEGPNQACSVQNCMRHMKHMPTIWAGHLCQLRSIPKRRF
jgi:hypothetical protein